MYTEIKLYNYNDSRWISLPVVTNTSDFSKQCEYTIMILPLIEIKSFRAVKMKDHERTKVVLRDGDVLTVLSPINVIGTALGFQKPFDKP